MQCQSGLLDDINYNVQNVNSFINFNNVAKVLDSFTTSKGTQELEIDLKYIQSQLGFNDNWSLSEYSKASRDLFLDQLIKKEHIDVFLAVEGIVTNMLIESIINSRKFLIQNDYLSVFFPNKWSVRCFDENSHAIHDTFPLLSKLFEQNADTVYINACSWIHFALLSFIDVFQSGLYKFQKKYIQRQITLESKLFCENPTISDHIKHDFDCDNGVVIKTDTFSSIQDGGSVKENALGWVRVSNEQDLKDMLSIPHDMVIDTVTISNEDKIKVDDWKRFVDAFVFKCFDSEDDDDLQKELHINNVIKTFFDNASDLNKQTLLAVYPNNNGHFFNHTHVKVTYKRKNATTRVGHYKDKKNKGPEAKPQEALIEPKQKEYERLKDLLKQKTDSINLPIRQHAKDKLSKERDIIIAQLDVFEKKMTNIGSTSDGTNKSQLSSLFREIHVIPYKTHHGTIKDVTLTFEEVKALMTSVVAFLRVCAANGYTHFNVNPSTILYNVKTGKKQFYLGDYQSILKADMVGKLDPFYAHPDIFKQVCSNDKEDYVSNIKHVFRKLINNVYRTNIPSVEQAYRSDKFHYYYKRYMKSYLANENSTDTSVYSFGITLLEILCSSTSINHNEFDALLDISMSCLSSMDNFRRLLDTVERLQPNARIDTNNNETTTYDFMTNANANKHIPNNVCFRNDKRSTYVYHVRVSQQRKFDYSNENVRVIDVEIKNIQSYSILSSKVLESFVKLQCDRNILVYGSSNSQTNTQALVVKLMQEMVDSLPKNKRWNNVTFIHECKNTANVVFDTYNDKKQLVCKKIVNAIISNLVFYPGTNDALQKNWNYTILDQDTNRNYTLRAVQLPTSTNTTQLEEAWWYKWYITSPYCVFGRFIQFSGTCWFNSVINSLILVPSIAVILIYMYGKWAKSLDQQQLKDFEDNASFYKCPVNMSVKDVLYTIVYLIFIKGQRATASKDDFISHYASIVKSSSEYGTTEYYQALIKQKGLEDARKDYGGNGYYVIDGMKELLLQVFPSNIAVMIKVEDYAIASHTLPEWEPDFRPYIVVMRARYHNSKLNTNVELNGQQYILQSCSIVITKDKGKDGNHSTHAVTGLICNGKSFIYNSWNDIVQTDWINYDFKDFFDYTNAKHKKRYALDYIHYLVYVREDIKKIFEKRYSELGDA